MRKIRQNSKHIIAKKNLFDPFSEKLISQTRIPIIKFTNR